MVLKIPYSDSMDAAAPDLESINLGNSINTSETKRIAIMLPFKLNKIVIDSVADTKSQLQKDPFLKMSMDFYSGAVVALDSLEKMGASLRVDVYDTKNMVSEVSKILDDNNFEDVSAVIGPFMPNNIQKVATELKKYNIPVVSPITKNVST